MDYKSLEKILNDADVKKSLQEYRASLEDPDEITQRTLQIIYYLNLEIYLTDPTNLPFASVDRTQCTEDLWNALEPLLTCDIPSELRTKLYDFSWLFYGNYKCAQNAFNGYLDLLEKLPADHQLLSSFCRCVSLCQSLKKKELKTQLGTQIEAIVQKYLQQDDSPYWILYWCFEYSLVSAEELLRICNNAESNSAMLHDQYYRLKIDILQKTQLKDKEKQIIETRRALIDLYKKMADGRNAFGGVHCLKLALKELRKIPNTEQERQELHKELSELQAATMTQTHSHRIPLDANKETEALRKCMDTTDVQQLLYLLVSVTDISGYERTKNELINDKTKHIFSALFSNVILDERGKTVAYLPTLNHTEPEKDKHALEAHMCFYLQEHYALTASIYIRPVVWRIKSLSEDYLGICQKIVSDCFFIPEDRKEAFSKGLAAGMDGDYITALSILLPQLENAIRCLAEDLGGVVYGMSEDGTERVRTMDDIISLKEVTDGIHEDILINIQALFLSRYGANLRNCIAHGMVSDSSFQSALCMYAWAFIFRLCYMWQPYNDERLTFEETERKRINGFFNDTEDD